MEPNKQYGLIKMNSKAPSAVKKGNLGKASALFDDSDSDGAGDADLIMPSRQALQRKDKVQISQALEEDPNVYQYDEVYDEMKGKNKKDDEKVSLFECY